ncbi:MAG: sigma-70 family RNA polymerase sigma factor [Phycisphaerae bacterium]|nr:sigma-70 family RNA polymerase sigma factor [Phycisphaerae bacterium]MDD5380306.1 sigma-70 family RNA polymerase sigma factor [Phycisphaerae bacterium]
MIEDEILKWRFRQGSKEAFCRIYEKYLDYLLTLAIGLSSDFNTAEDIVHDVFVRLASSRGNFRQRGNLKSYLTTCVVNQARDQIRRDVRQRDRLNQAAIAISERDHPEKAIISDELSQRLNKAVSELPYEQRETVVLHLKGGMRFREIAKLQGESINTVQGRYRYGLDKLRSMLNDEV